MTEGHNFLYPKHIPRYIYDVSWLTNDILKESSKRADARQDTARCVPTIRSIASTRGVSVKTTHTDTTQTLRITLKPDTIFVPYVHHIRSDTIVAPDPTTKTKMQKTQTANLLLILIIIAIIIIFFDRMTKGHNL